MTINQILAGALALLTAGLAAQAISNSLPEDRNSERFKGTGELRAPRWQSILFAVGTGLANLLALVFAHDPSNSDSWVVSLVAAIAMAYVWSTTFSGVRLESTAVKFGRFLRKEIPYSDIETVEIRSTGRDRLFFIHARNSGRSYLGADLPCEDLLLSELQNRSNCEIVRGPQFQNPRNLR